MPTVEERIAFVEGRQQDHFATLDDLRTTVRDLRADMNRQFADVRSEIRTLSDRVDRQFTWLVGLQVASMVAMLGVLAGAYYK